MKYALLQILITGDDFADNIFIETTSILRFIRHDKSIENIFYGYIKFMYKYMYYTCIVDENLFFLIV